MYIYLPYVTLIDPEDPPEDLKELVERSFERFSRDTNKEYLYNDKLLYLDHVRKCCIGIPETTDSEDAVLNLIANDVKEKIRGGDALDKDDYFSLSFLTECYDAGFYPFYKDYIPHNKQANERMKQMIVKIITIVMNYESDDELDEQ